MIYFLTIVLIYVGFLAFLYVYQRNLMYFPDILRPPPAVFGVDEVEIARVRTADELDLEGWYFEPLKADFPVILLFHGNAQNYAYRIYKVRPFLEAGYGVLLAGYRGYGGNPGTFSQDGFFQDARAYLDWLQREKGHAADEIVLYGESLGTGVAVQMASERSVKAVILESSYHSMASLAQSKYPVFPVKYLIRDPFPSFERIGAVKAPKLFVHGARDTLIPVRFAQKLYEAASEPKKFVVIPEAGHNDIYDHGGALHVLEFLSNITLSSEAAPSENDRQGAQVQKE